LSGDHDLYDHVATTAALALPVEEVLAISRGLAAGLGHVHAEGFAHNDIKLENILMCRVQGTLVPKLIDFEGLTHSGQRPASRVTGTLAYFAPERHSRLGFQQENFDRQASDMYSLGVTLHLTAFGTFPNGTIEAAPVLMSDFVAPVGTRSVLAVLLEGLLKADAAQRWTAAKMSSFLALDEQPNLDGVAGHYAGTLMYAPLEMEKEMIMEMLLNYETNEQTTHPNRLI
jgi:serine/threonine protein kinase